MLDEKVLVRNEVCTISRIQPDHRGNGHRRDILPALERATRDSGFIAQLTFAGGEALQG
jgi:hypothetical protein